MDDHICLYIERREKETRERENDSQRQDRLEGEGEEGIWWIKWKMQRTKLKRTKFSFIYCNPRGHS